MISEREPVPSGSIDGRLKSRWNKLLRVLAERSEAFWLDLAMEAFRKNQYNDALVNLYQAVAINPNNTHAFKLKGMILQLKAYEAKDIEQHEVLTRAMLKAYQRAIEADQNLRANIENRLKHLYYFEFKRGVQTVAQGEEDETAFGTAATYFELAALIRRSITSEMPASDTPWGAYVNQGLSHLNAGQAKAAMEAFEEAVQQGDTSTDTFLLLADLYEEDGAQEKAVLLLERAWRYLPSIKTQLEAALLNAYFRAGLTDRALPVYEGALAREPDNKRLRYNYGTLLLEQEAFDDAAEHFQAAIDLDPYDAKAQYNLGAAFFNKAVSIDTLIREQGDQLQANQASMAGHEISQTQVEIEALVQQQQTLFTQAASSLEKAHVLTESTGGEASDICAALRLAYRKRGEMEKVEALAAWEAGYEGHASG